jgi:hypothetical protein
MLIYISQITPRIEYVFELFFKEIFSMEYALTSDKSMFEKAAGAKMIYGEERFCDAIFVQAHTLLFESSITPQRIEKIEEKDCVGLFESKDSDFTIEIFASAFYLVSRYEEYLPHHVDQYKRYGASNSIAYHFRFLRKPMINYYADALKYIIEAKYTDVKINYKKFQYIPTYDIDHVTKYQGKGIFRNLGGLAKSLITFKGKDFIERTKTVFFGQKDPYDVFASLDRLHKRYNLYPVYFLLFTRNITKIDGSISYKKQVFKDAIKRISDQYEVGIHPSFASTSQFKDLQREVEIYLNYTKKPLTRSRQHFLKVKMPEAYQNLIQLGVKEDHTMGYSSRPGFRASICQPFQWFDLSTNTPTELRIFPFAFMDATFKYYKQYKSEKIRERLLDLYHETKRFGGVYITDFHNDILSDERFMHIYEGFLNDIKE